MQSSPLQHEVRMPRRGRRHRLHWHHRRLMMMMMMILEIDGDGVEPERGPHVHVLDGPADVAPVPGQRPGSQELLLLLPPLLLLLLPPLLLLLLPLPLLLQRLLVQGVPAAQQRGHGGEEAAVAEKVGGGGGGGWSEAGRRGFLEASVVAVVAEHGQSPGRLVHHAVGNLSVVIPAVWTVVVVVVGVVVGIGEAAWGLAPVPPRGGEQVPHQDRLLLLLLLVLEVVVVGRGSNNGQAAVSLTCSGAVELRGMPRRSLRCPLTVYAVPRPSFFFLFFTPTLWAG